MDFMFEDDVDEVGSDVEAYCPKCKADTTHVVISKYEDEIRRVQCNPCGDVHSFRKPRGEAEEDMPEPVAARKRALLKKLTWEEFFAKHGERNAKPYEFRDTYRENAIVFHPKFGKGYVSEVVSESKVEITFSDARRILVHNRKDIPGSPVGREDDGLPSTAVPAKGAGKAKAVEKQAGKQATAKHDSGSKSDLKHLAPRSGAKRGEVAERSEAGEGLPVSRPKDPGHRPGGGTGKKVEDRKADAAEDTRAEDRKAAAKKPAPSKASVAKKPAASKPAARKPAAKKLAAKKPVAKKPVAKKPVAKKPVAKKPVAKKKSK